ncbi:hypothetical protein ACIPSE_33670 [Streptomyces sp. NPDC090106]|uniref:hypothetical protein n=1 Tax=Streptomyces sp. NPDC090106 TaxID=3365946 RepID=UPI0038140127
MSNEVRLVRLFVSSVANGIQDDTPNEVGGNATSPFYLMIEAAAGTTAGNNKVGYTLVIRACSTSGTNTTFAPVVRHEQAGDPNSHWNLTTPGVSNGYVKSSVLTVDAASFEPDGLYEFVGMLRLGDNTASWVRSNEFLII